MQTLSLHGNLITLDPAEGALGQPTKFYYVPEVWVDDQPLVDFRWYAVFLHELAESTLRSGRFAILTCWCGMPECAGIYRPLEVSHAPTAITWTIQQPIERECVFAPQAYRQAVADGLARLRRDWADLQAAVSGSAEEVDLIPGLPPDIALVAPPPYRPRPKRRPPK